MVLSFLVMGCNETLQTLVDGKSDKDAEFVTLLRENCLNLSSYI